MEIVEMTVDQIEARKAEILTELDAPEADLDALEEEVRCLNQELETRKAAEAERVELRKAVAEGAGKVTEAIEPEERKNAMTFEEVRKSPEYMQAYETYIKTGRDDECRALLTELASGSVPVPYYMEARINTAWEKLGLMGLVRKTFVKGVLKVGFEVSATAATVHTEGANAVSAETLVLGTVTLTPVSVKKYLPVSDEAMDLTGPDFYDYVVDELTYQIAKEAQKQLLAKITVLTASATTNAVGVGIVAGTPSVGIVAAALGTLSDEAVDPVIVMNKGTWAQFKAAQYAGAFNVDPFEGMAVHFDNSLPAYTSNTSTLAAGTAWAIVGDFGRGAQANFPNGQEIKIKYDDLTDAPADLVRFVGREYVGLGIVADHAFAKITQPAS